MDRFLALFKRFEKKNNEELYSICVEQIAELYKNDPKKFGYILFQKMKDYIMSKSTDKRLIGAAIFQKVCMKTFLAKDFSRFLLTKKEMDFDVEKFIIELSMSKRRRRTSRKIDEYKKIMNIDLVKFNQEQVRVHLCKRDNCLYSKSSKKIESQQKKSNRVSQQDELNLLKQFNEKGEDELTFLKKGKKKAIEEIDLEMIKKNKNNQEQDTDNKDLIFDEFTSILDVIFRLCQFLIFHQSWELRHGALLVFRAIVRNFKEIISFQKLLDEKIIKSQDKFQPINTSLIKGTFKKQAQISLNEDIKQSCLLLLSLDRFSDFRFDKSNMTNRALAVEILAICFKNLPNLSTFFYISEILFTLNLKSGWEPKQGIILLTKKLIEDSFQIDGETEVKIEMISKDQIQTILSQINKYINVHEEITEIAAEFITQLSLRKPEYLEDSLCQKLQNNLIQTLEDTDNISYVPKSIFELFSVLLKQNRLIPDVVQKLEDFIKKFLFHNNKEVRKEIFLFIKTFFQFLTNKSQYNITQEKKKFFFYTMLFYFLIEMNHQDIEEISLIICNVISSMAIKNIQEVLSLLFKLFDYPELSESVKHLNVAFNVNIQKDLQIDFMQTLELCIIIISKLEQKTRQKVLDLIDSQNDKSQSNSLLYILKMYFYSIENEEDRETVIRFIKFDKNKFTVPFFEEQYKEITSKIENYMGLHVKEISNLGQQQLNNDIYNILKHFENRSQMKENLGNMVNSFIDFTETVKKLIIQNKIKVSHKKLLVEINNSFLPILNNLLSFMNFNIALIKCSANNIFLQNLLENQQLLPKKMINHLIKPFLEIFSYPLSQYWQLKISTFFFNIVLIYDKQEKAPTKKVIGSLMKKISNLQILNNTYFFFKRVFQHYEITTLTKFTNLEIIFENHLLIQGFHSFMLEYQQDNWEVRLFFQKKILNCLTHGLLLNENSFIVIQNLFQVLTEDFKENQVQNMKEFLSYLNSLINSKSEIAFKIFLDLLQNFKKEFILFAKIYLTQIITCINQQVDYDKDIIFDCFTQVLTLSYIEDEHSNIFKLDEKLVKSYQQGKLFLYEFNNNKNFQINLNPVLNKIENFALREYQLEGIRWVNFLFKYGLSGSLCDDMGLGKTIQSLCSLGLIYTQPEVKKDSLVVCPNNLMYHWQKECKKYINSSIFTPVIVSSKQLRNASNLKVLRKHISEEQKVVFITTYHTITSCVKYFDKFSFEVIILDEAHMIKNPKSKLAISIKTIKSRLRLALTGTPIQNNVAELWSIFDFLMPLYLGTKEKFRRKFKALLDLHLITVDTKKMELSSNQSKILKNLHVKVLPFIMRREKTQVLKDLPPKIIQDISAEMTETQERLYNHFKYSDLSTMNGQVEDSAKHVKQSFLKILSNLRKIMNHPKLLVTLSKDRHKVGDSFLHYDEIIREKVGNIVRLNKDYFISGKFIALKQLMNNLNYVEDDEVSCLDNCQKILLFTRCNRTLEILRNFFKDIFKHLKTCSLNKDLSLQDRNRLVETFNEDPTIKLMLLTPKIGGLGLNLASANIVIMFDHDFNPMNDLQAMDRAHRLGQKKTVNVYRLVMRNTLEEKIMGIQKFKLSVANTIINSENATIDNVKESKFVNFLENFASENVKDEKQENQNLYKNLGVYAKYMKQSGLDDWDEDEYDKEFV